MSQQRSIIIYLLGAASFAFLVFVTLMRRDLNIYDESIVLTGALQTLNGEIPHRDYYAIYGPAQNYIVALLFSIFGKSLVITRFYSILTMTMIVLVSFLINIGRTGWFFSLVTITFVTGFLDASQSHLYPIYPVILLSLLGALVLTRRHEPPSLGSVAFAGACAGCAALFRYDSGFFLLVCFSVYFAIMAWLRPSQYPARTAMVNVLVAGIASGAVFLPFALSYLLVASPEPFLHDIIEVSLTIYRKYRALPFPQPDGTGRIFRELGVYFPIIVLAITAWESTASRIWRQQRPRDAKDLPVVVMMSVLTLILYYKGIVRVSTLHMLMSIVPATVLLGLTLDRVLAHRGWKLAAPLLLLAAVPPAGAMAFELKGIINEPDRALAIWALRGPSSASLCNAVDGQSLIGIEDDYLATQRYLTAHMPRHEKLLVGLNRHDRTFANPLVLYFLADRSPGTRWFQFDAGLQSRSDIQRQIIADLQRNKVKWVVRDSAFDDRREPNESAKSSGVFLLDTYLDQNFRPVAEAGKVQIWLAKSVPAPAAKPGMTCVAAPVAAQDGGAPQA